MCGWRGTRKWLNTCSRRLPMQSHLGCTYTRTFSCVRVPSVQYATSSHRHVSSLRAGILPAPVSASVCRFACRTSTSFVLPYDFGRSPSPQRRETMVVLLRNYVVVPAILCRAWHTAAVQPPHFESATPLVDIRSTGPDVKIGFGTSLRGELCIQGTRDQIEWTRWSLHASNNLVLRRFSGLGGPSTCFATPSRNFSTYSSDCSGMSEDKAGATINATIELLSKNVEEEITDKRQRLDVLRRRHGKQKIGDVTFQHVLGGMRGLTALLTETSSLDPSNGITYRGYTIEELIQKLPRFANEEYPPVEGVIWLLLTGKIPSAEQAQLLSAALNALSCSSAPPSAAASPDASVSSSSSPFSATRAAAASHFIPQYTHDTLDHLPTSTHPMTQLVVGVTSLQPCSRLAAAYQQGTRKDLLWKSALYDGLSVIAKTAVLAARIYQRSFRPDAQVPVPRLNLDWGANFAAMLGLENPEAFELIRLYMLLHADHEGGNVSAHAAHVAGSALSDLYLSTAAGLAGLAGPLHGLANQECLKWLQGALAELKGEEPTPELVKKIAQKTLERGRVIPGYGHAVLRVTDPRFLVQRKFALKHLKGDKLFRLLDVAHKVIPEVLLATGKVQNPYPNVDCHSGVLLHHYDVKESRYYTVLFGVARSIGIAAQHVLSRGLLLPIERPKSITIEELEEKVKKESAAPS